VPLNLLQNCCETYLQLLIIVVIDQVELEFILTCLFNNLRVAFLATLFIIVVIDQVELEFIPTCLFNNLRIAFLATLNNQQLTRPSYPLPPSFWCLIIVIIFLAKVFCCKIVEYALDVIMNDWL